MPDRNIESLLNHVDSSVRRLDKHGNLRMHRHVAGKCVSETPLRQECRAAEANESCWLSAQFRHAVEGGLRPFDRSDTPFKEALARGGQS